MPLKGTPHPALMCVGGGCPFITLGRGLFRRGVTICLRAERWVKRKQFRDQPTWTYNKIFL